MATVDNIKVDDCTKHGQGVMVYFPERSRCPVCSLADALETIGTEVKSWSDPGVDSSPIGGSNRIIEKVREALRDAGRKG